MSVRPGELKDLGKKLELDEVKLERVFGYDPKEHHQRLIEAWFEQQYKPPREKLLEALPRRESSVSISSDKLPVPPTFTPTSEPSNGNVNTVIGR